MSDNLSAGTIIVYGTSWCSDCKRAKQFFGEHRIQYVWVDIEHDSDAMAYVEEVNKGLRSVPTIVFPDGSILVEPSNAQLAEKFGLQTRAQRTFYDVIIVGAGPAGLTAAVYAGREGLETLVIEKGALGGQAGSAQMMENFPGFDEGISGDEFARRLGIQARRFGAEILQATEVKSLRRDGRYICVTVSDGTEYTAQAVLIASGARYRWLNVPGEDKLIGSRIHFCAVCDGAFYKGKEVLVIGGGNSGFQEGLFLTRFARKVTIVEFEPQVKASRILQKKVAEKGEMMQVITNHAVKEFRQRDSQLEAVIVEDRATGALEEWHPDGVFVFIGLSPNSAFLPPEVERDRFGFVTTGPGFMTTLPGVFAAGDVRQASTKQAAVAVGEGAAAALMIREYLAAQSS